jgi:hypothetical protein
LDICKSQLVARRRSTYRLSLNSTPTRTRTKSTNVVAVRSLTMAATNISQRKHGLTLPPHMGNDPPVSVSVSRYQRTHRGWFVILGSPCGEAELITPSTSRSSHELVGKNRPHRWTKAWTPWVDYRLTGRFFTGPFLLGGEPSRSTRLSNGATSLAPFHPPPHKHVPHTSEWLALSQTGQ